MAHTLQAFQDFQRIVNRSVSPLRKFLMASLLDNISTGEVYAFGGDNRDAFAVFTDPSRTVQTYLLSESRFLRTPPYFVTLGRSRGQITFHDWSLIDAVIKWYAQEYAAEELDDVQAVRVLGPVQVSLLITTIGEAYDPVFLIPKNLSPVQGLVTIYRAFTTHENQITRRLLSRQETEH